jgi:hypothetical protein
MSELADLIAEQSQKLTDQTDLFPEAASLVVTRGTEVDGNTVTVVLHTEEEDEDPDDGLVLGFQDETFDQIAADFARESTEPWCHLYPSDYEALDAAIREASHVLTGGQLDRLEMLRDAAPEPDEDDEPTLGDYA